MKRTERPIILTIYELLKPIKTTRSKLNEISDELKKDNLREITIQGLFVLGITSFEIMISEILTYFLNSIPQKLEIKEIKVSKDDLLNEDLVGIYVEKTIISLLYKRFDEILDNFFSVLSINFKSKDKYIDRLVEMKETRNLLLHNNLVVNNLYLDKTLSYKRATYINQTIKIDSKYTFDSISTLYSLVDEIEEEITSKYSNYTKIKLLRDLWDYLFDSRILVFDDYWHIDEEHDTIPGLKHYKYETQICSSEKMFLGVWRAQFSNDTGLLNHFNMRTLSSDNQRRMIYFLSIANKISFY